MIIHADALEVMRLLASLILYNSLPTFNRTKQAQRRLIHMFNIWVILSRYLGDTYVIPGRCLGGYLEKWT